MIHHQTYTTTENNIEYNVLEYTMDNKRDTIKLEKFIDKYKYVKLIEIVDRDEITANYFKKGRLHNSYGPAVIIVDADSKDVKSKEFYLNDIKIDEKDFKSHIRNLKLKKLNEISDQY